MASFSAGEGGGEGGQGRARPVSASSGGFRGNFQGLDCSYNHLVSGPWRLPGRCWLGTGVALKCSALGRGRAVDRRHGVTGTCWAPPPTTTTSLNFKTDHKEEGGLRRREGTRVRMNTQDTGLLSKFIFWYEYTFLQRALCKGTRLKVTQIQ